MRLPRMFLLLLLGPLVAAPVSAETTIYIDPGLACGETGTAFPEWKIASGNLIHESFDSADEMDPLRDGYALSSGSIVNAGIWSVDGEDVVLEIIFNEPGTSDPQPIKDCKRRSKTGTRIRKDACTWIRNNGSGCAAKYW